MLIGAHVSIAGGIDRAPARAAELGLETFQCFTRSPQGGPAPKLTSDIVDSFLRSCDEHSLREWVVHTPYYINLAHASETTRKNSARIIREELERASIIGATYVMTHVGSSRDVGHEQGIALCIDGVKRVMDGYRGSAQFLIEISAGAGYVLGGTFEDLADILRACDADVRICYDTQHGFAAGYDIRTPEAVKRTLDDFDRIIGLDKLVISHCNDSKVAFSSQKDRHDHIGDGHIGRAGFEAWFADARTRDINLYLETPHDDLIARDIAILKELRKK